jgi:hypothetical protein
LGALRLGYVYLGLVTVVIFHLDQSGHEHPFFHDLTGYGRQLPQ